MDLKIRLRKKLDEIAQVLFNEEVKNTEIGVLGGLSGIALFQFYYSKFIDNDKYAIQGAETISEVFNRIEKGYSYPTFCDGIAGACWALELLKEEGFIELEKDIITESLDRFLLEQMRKDMANNHYDFLHGALGYGYYFLKRYKNVMSEDLKLKYQDYIYELIAFLKNSFIKNEVGVFWKSIIRVGTKSFEGFNLGLSHGIPSIINFLSILAKEPIFYNEVYDMIHHASMFVLSSKHTSKKYTSSFPNWISLESSQVFNSRLAWCYGDLGVGISLLKAGEILKNDQLIRETILMLKESTKRRSIRETMVEDSGMCHGAFGIMHIYEFLFRKTHDSKFSEASNFWATVGINMAVHEDGYAGYLFGGKNSLRLENCLLDGIAGVGLAIISFLANFPLIWDQSMLIK